MPRKEIPQLRVACCLYPTCKKWAAVGKALFLSLVVLLSCYGCTNSAGDLTIGKVLINGIRSHQSFGQVKRILKGKNYAIIKGSPGDRILIVSIANYEVLGVRGNMHLDFFDDKLMSAALYPQTQDDDSKLRKRLKQQLGLPKDKEIYKVLNGVLVSRGEYRNNREGVVWKDIGLSAQHSQWAFNYG